MGILETLALTVHIYDEILILVMKTSQLVDCDQKSCQNGGTCRNGLECTCLVGFEGDFCENRTTTPTISTSDRPVVEDDITPEEAAIDQNGMYESPDKIISSVTHFYP